MKKPNDYGLFDMLGNAWEWCDNIDEPGVVLEDSGTQTDVRDNVGRVLRGTSVHHQASNVRSAYREYNAPSRLAYDFGFRAARTLDDERQGTQRAEVPRKPVWIMWRNSSRLGRRV